MFGQLSGDVTSTLYLNVLTGRVEEQIDAVTLSGNPLAQISYKLSKLAWGSKLKAKQVGNTVRTHKRGLLTYVSSACLTTHCAGVPVANFGTGYYSSAKHPKFALVF